jgi:predicted RND superfamily exporter protein
LLFANNKSVLSGFPLANDGDYLSPATSSVRDEAVKAWEQAYSQLVDEFARAPDPDSRQHMVVPYATHSRLVHEETKNAVNDDMHLLPIQYGVIFLYACFAMYSKHAPRQWVTALFGICEVILALIMTIGIAGYTGIHIHSATPLALFVLIAVGLGCN